ncbi:Hypothetical protein R9X50_00042600 [Acrodontium crateriforme]|uniref:Glutamate decarboxylase n=1 Tax=Acrodontium crateriforme TaxID=150365 RepID=A0AAQ3M373_9PEZI|nr:Hypothetical protein R9X50_00042600 [Acrodontium crateriforme]
MHRIETSSPAVSAQEPFRRAEEADDLITGVKDLVVQFIRAADDNANAISSPTTNGHALNGNEPRSVLVDQCPPKKLEKLLNLSFPDQGTGRDGLMQMVQSVLQYSVNTWDQGFLDKLYAANTPVGLAADLLLSALNTNLHVYQVSPALTIIEKTTAKALATMFGLTGPHAGGISQPGGSAANQSAMVIARNHLFPETKAEGYGGRKFVLFTSAHGHYSLEKAAQMFGFGSKAVRGVSVDERGCMLPAALDAAITASKEAGETPFFVNATAGTTVMGSFDPLDAIADVCEKHHLWMHVDGSWGGPVVFSTTQRTKLAGSERADSIALCPHKMLNVPVTCSFLLGKDMRLFHKGMTLPASYLFHASSDGEVWDLADLTPQCGRRGDSLKLALAWLYYGTSGLGASVDHAFTVAAHLAKLVKAKTNFSLVSESPPPCLQVCFYYRKQSATSISPENIAAAHAKNTETTKTIARALIAKGFMGDFAPGPEGMFFRVVVNCQTRMETADALIRIIEEVAESISF